MSEDSDYVYSYDNEGNRTRRDSKSDSSFTTYQWDHRNRLASVTEFDTTGQPTSTIDYRYNTDDSLVRKTTGSATEHYLSVDGERVLQLEDDGDVRSRAIWAPGTDQLLIDEVFDTNGQLTDTLWAANDHRGSVRQLLDLNEDVVEHRDFDSFGTLRTAYDQAGALITASQLRSTIGYTGKHFDADAKLQYNRARWYDPNVGRFLNEDPAGFAARAERHRFCGCDPALVG